jgi:DNA-directed RNA polymerase subunit F
MPERADLTKHQKVKREIGRLRRVLKDLDRNMMQVVVPLIENAAFMSVSLKELEEIINEQGYTVEYKNGENQFGTKQSDEVKTHIAMLKNLATVIKTLADIAPPTRRKDSRLQALRDE